MFVRFGGLNLKKQKGFGSDSYHSPPASRGFYAMPKIAQEFFLIGSISETQPSIFPKNKDYSEENNKHVSNIYSLIRKEFRKDTGYIWSHLEEYVKHHQIVEKHNSWIKTSLKDWSIAFTKMSIVLRFGDDQGIFSTKSVNEVRGIVGYYSKDHCEVFFDEKV